MGGGGGSWIQRSAMTWSIMPALPGISGVPVVKKPKKWKKDQNRTTWHGLYFFEKEAVMCRLLSYTRKRLTYSHSSAHVISYILDHVGESMSINVSSNNLVVYIQCFSNLLQFGWDCYSNNSNDEIVTLCLRWIVMNNVQKESAPVLPFLFNIFLLFWSLGKKFEIS